MVMEEHAPAVSIKARVVCDDAFQWLAREPEAGYHAVVTDPPFGVKEYDPEQLAKRESGKGGVWRIPPSFDGHIRSPLPRFTALTEAERAEVREFFEAFGKQAARVLRPGGHVFLASNSFLSPLVFGALIAGGLEYRGTVVRLVRTLRGGDRPKGAEDEFGMVSSMPRGCYEPWGIFRRPLPAKMTVAECLRRYQTGGLRRISDEQPFEDVIQSERTPERERALSRHPSMKPQRFLRQVVAASLPLGEGTVLDPFMGSGATLGAAEALGVPSVGVDRDEVYVRKAPEVIVRLAALSF